MDEKIWKGTRIELEAGNLIAINTKQYQQLCNLRNELVAVCEKLLFDLAEAHAAEKDADHYGDDSCSYCEDIKAAEALVAKAKEV